MQRSCADMNSPSKRKSWTYSGGPLVNSLRTLRSGSVFCNYAVFWASESGSWYQLAWKCWTQIRTVPVLPRIQIRSPAAILGEYLKGLLKSVIYLIFWGFSCMESGGGKSGGILDVCVLRDSISRFSGAGTVLVYYRFSTTRISVVSVFSFWEVVSTFLLMDLLLSSPFCIPLFFPGIGINLSKT
jgi:hypothetical protein